MTPLGIESTHCTLENHICPYARHASTWENGDVAALNQSRHQMGMSSKIHIPAALMQKKEPEYPMNEGLGGAPEPVSTSLACARSLSSPQSRHCTPTALIAALR